LSASTSCSERALQALAAIRHGERVPEEEARALGEECSAEFFRLVIEALADSFDPEDVTAYERLMRVWIPEAPCVTLVIPDRVELVYVLSRVTLGSDIKIVSGLLDCARHRFPQARIVLVGGRKTAELFAADQRIGHLEANYPRSGPVTERLEFAHALREQLEAPQRIVLDPDSRMTQLGLIPVCEPEHYFHFPSRSAQTDSTEDLSRLARNWFEQHFGKVDVARSTYIAPDPVVVTGGRPRAAVSLGVGGNDTKRVGGDFEAHLIRSLAERYNTVWIDRGAGGEESLRVTAAVNASDSEERVRFWEGGFAGFASIIAQSDLYVGYDSAGQHAAAASQTPLVTIFAGAPSLRFQQRWTPYGEGNRFMVEADGISAAAVHDRLLQAIPLTNSRIPRAPTTDI
jgi:ADP-heptose:LPS heptosyltransferase